MRAIDIIQQITKRRIGFLLIFIVVSLGFCGCSDEVKEIGEAASFDPSQPVEILDFMPKSGGAGQRLVLYGSNFGNDASKITVLIGGKKAKVINAQGESLYCLVPKQAFGGEIEVRIGEEDHQVVGRSQNPFDYLR